MSGYEATLLAGRYRLIRRLGVGGTAAVFLSCDERLGRNVAIKRLHGAEVTAETAQRLQREARIMASLRHPNLVTVYDMVTVEDDLLLTMEYVPGETLAELLAGAPLEWERTRDVLGPVASALDYVHAHGVVHRDVKPSNVLIGTSGIVKLTDLGLATAAEITRITPPGAILGTPAYMAPEQARASTCTGAVDIYALATIVFQALTGVLPRAGSTVIAVLAQATREPPPDLRKHRPEAPEAAALALMRGLSAEPQSRQATASQLLEEIDAAYERPRARAEPGRERRRTRAAHAAAPPARRERRPATGAGRRGERHNLRARVLALATLAVFVVAVIAVIATSGGGSGGNRALATPTASTTATAVATASPAQTVRPARALSPSATVRAFYTRAAAGDYAGAWKLAGPGMRAAFAGSLERFRSEMSSLRRIDFQRLAVTQRGEGSATVTIESVATHTDRVDRCSGTLRTVRSASGRWLVEPAGVSCTH